MKLRFASLLLSVCMLLVWVSGASAAYEPTISSVPELQVFLSDRLWMLPTEVSYCYTENMESIVSNDVTNAMLMFSRGVMTWHYRIDKTANKVTYYDIEYYPGRKVANAFTSVGTDGLSSREWQLLNRATSIVNEGWSHCKTELDMAKWLHDYLCLNVKYSFTTELGDDDTAYGALLNGWAECDGYSDAYYLLCRLAGLQVGCQFGFSDPRQRVEDRHQWNTLNVNGQWYHVDVTWDDKNSVNYPDVISYRYFLCGANLMTDHYWDDSLADNPLAPWTDWTIFPYSCNVEGIGAYVETMNDAGQYIYRSWKNGYQQVHVMVKGHYSDNSSLNKAIQNTAVRNSWVFWQYEADEYTCFDVYFIK